MIDNVHFKTAEGIALIEANLKKRNYPQSDLDDVLQIIRDRNEGIQALEVLQAERNSVAKEISVCMVQKDIEGAEVKKRRGAEISEQIKVLKESQEQSKARYQEVMYRLPNLLQEDVPEGEDEESNVLLRTYGEIPEYSFEVKPHYEIAESLDLIDFKRGVKLSGTRFYIYNEEIAILERKLTDLMLHWHRQAGYKERMVPLLVHEASMFGTGQLPKFADDFYRTEDGYSLIPTAEVALTNIYADEVLDESILPISLTASTPCFRKEAGSAGRDTRGLIRVHQFSKVELVKFCTPETSAVEHEVLTKDAERILQKLNLTYRVMLLCVGDTSATSSKTYDLEVYMPGLKEWREISSCSNFHSYQARRAGIRYKSSQISKPQLVHTLNGSGLALGRLVAVLLEYYQTASGEIDFVSLYSKIEEAYTGEL